MGKSKRSKRHEQPLHEKLAEISQSLRAPVEEPVPPTVPSNPAPRPLPLSLADIRTETLKHHSNVAHTIADLEAWVAEIEATIAFLKARDR